MRRNINPLILLGTFLGTALAIGLAVSLPSRAHDNPTPHIHIKGTITSTTPGARLKDATVKQVEAGVFPGLPCEIERWDRPNYDAGSGSYDLVVYVRDSKMGGGGAKGQDCRSLLPSAPINVDKTKIRWDAYGFTIAPR